MCFVEYQAQDILQSCNLGSSCFTYPVIKPCIFALKLIFWTYMHASLFLCHFLQLQIGLIFVWMHIYYSSAWSPRFLFFLFNFPSYLQEKSFHGKLLEICIYFPPFRSPFLYFSCFFHCLSHNLWIPLEEKRKFCWNRHGKWIIWDKPEKVVEKTKKRRKW